MAFLTLQKNFTIGMGDSLGLLCAFFFAVHLVLIEHYSAKKDPVLMAVIQLGAVFIISFSAAPFLEVWPKIITSKVFWSIVYTIIFCTVLAFLIQNVAQKFTPSTHAAIILSLESVFGALAGIFMPGELFTGQMILGAVLILIAVIITVVPVKNY